MRRRNLAAAIVAVVGTVLVGTTAGNGSAVGAASGGAASTASTTPTTIIFDPGISIDDASVVEGDEGTTVMAFTVRLTAPSPTNTVVHYHVVDGTAHAPDDFVRGSYAFMYVPAGQPSAVLEVPVVPDRLDEADETFEVILNSTAGIIIDGRATGTIIDDDGSSECAALPTLSVADASAVESAGSTGFAITLSHAVPVDTLLEYGPFGGTATYGDDYYMFEGARFVSIPAGQVDGSAPAFLVDDQADEADETFSLRVSGAVCGVPREATATGTIIDDDAPPPPAKQVSVADVDVVEGRGGRVTRAVLWVELSEPATERTRVRLRTENGTALAGRDYRRRGGGVLIRPGQTRAPYFVSVRGDQKVEPDETFSVVVTQVPDGWTAPPPATVTIKNDD